MSSDAGCAGLAALCARLEAQVAQLEAEVLRLRMENDLLREKIVRLQNAIRMAIAVCMKYLAEAQQYLGQSSGVKRGNWAYARGLHRAAAGILAVLSQGR